MSDQGRKSRSCCPQTRWRGTSKLLLSLLPPVLFSPAPAHLAVRRRALAANRGSWVTFSLFGEDDLVLFDALDGGNGFLDPIRIDQGTVEPGKFKCAHRIGDNTRSLSSTIRAHLMADCRQVSDGIAQQDGASPVKVGDGEEAGLAIRQRRVAPLVEHLEVDLVGCQI